MIFSECCKNDQRHNGQKIWSLLACSSRRRIWFRNHTWSQKLALYVLWWKYGNYCLEMLMNVHRVYLCKLFSMLTWWCLLPSLLPIKHYRGFLFDQLCKYMLSSLLRGIKGKASSAAICGLLPSCLRIRINNAISNIQFRMKSAQFYMHC